MPKIDLHIHTRQVKEEPKERNIDDPDKFKDILKKSNIGIAAITNHNFFDKEQYEKFRDDEYLLLPGSEIDVDIDGNIRQLNVIFSDKNYLLFFEKMKNNFGNGENKISLKKLILDFDSDETIFYLDYKSNNKTKWTEEEIITFQKEVSGICIMDANNTITNLILLSNNFNSFIGSDNNNWDDYESKSVKLINVHEIKNYSSFLIILKNPYDNELIKKQIRYEKKFDLEIKDENKNIFPIKKLKITNGINVIFGAKSTGKTSLLRALYEKTSNSQSLFYETKDYKKEFANLQKNSDLGEAEEQITNFKQILGKIASHEETKVSNFSNFYNSFIYKNKTKIQFYNKTITAVIKPDFNNLFFKVSQKYMETYLLLNDKKLSLNQEIIIENKKLFNKTINELKNNFIEKYKDYFSYKILININKKISKILETKKAAFTKPNDLGLFDTFQMRQRLWNNIQNLKKIPKHFNFNFNEFEIPNGNKWILQKKVFLIDTNNKNINSKFNGKETKWKGIKDEYNNGLKILLSWTEEEKFKNPIQYIPNIYNLNNRTILYEVENKFINKETNITADPSNGEKAFMVLDNLLSDKNYESFYIDEPETFLGNQMISDWLIDKLKSLSLEGKKIFFTTHNNSLGINTMPYNYIYRSIELNNDDEKVYKTYYGSFLKEKDKLIDLETKDTLKLSEKLLEYFEGNQSTYSFRKEIYK